MRRTIVTRPGQRGLISELVDLVILVVEQIVSIILWPLYMLAANPLLMVMAVFMAYFLLKPTDDPLTTTQLIDAPTQQTETAATTTTEKDWWTNRLQQQQAHRERMRSY